MSAHERLEQAIQDFVREHLDDGGMVTEWVVVAAVADPEEPRAIGYAHAGSRYLPLHHAVGLLNQGIEEFTADCD